MEVSYPPGLPALNLDHNTAAMADEMDIDIGIDLNTFSDDQAVHSGIDQPTLTVSETQGNEIATFDIEQASQDTVTPHKIHIRGLDDLTTDDITDYVEEHFSATARPRIEWIDDTSANVVFDTPAIALQALKHLGSQELPNVFLQDLQLRSAKPYSKRSNSNLQIRIALKTDQKRPRAYEASRFYMMHPEFDPREQRRKEKSNPDLHNDYRRRRYGQDEQRRRTRKDRVESFDATMYDDNAGIVAARSGAFSSRRLSMRSDLASDDAISPKDQRPKRSGDYFRPRNRGRSASPDDRDGRSTRRRRTPPASNYRIADGNDGKELFPSKSMPDTALTVSDAQELFPHKKLAANLKKELFPTKIHAIHHRRSDAIDAADATADLFAHRLAFATKPEVVKRASGASSSNELLKTDSYADSLAVDDSAADDLSIRGASRKGHNLSTREVTANGFVKELFPDKAGTNAGKELFAEKLKGRGGKRNRAADMFY